MTIGTGHYSPGGQFSVQRSFCYNFAIENVFLPAGNPGPNFRFDPALYPGQHFHVYLLPEFWPWTSNSYTLDHIIVESYLVIDPDPTHIPYDFALKWLPGIPGFPAAVLFSGVAISSPPAYFPLDSQPPGYWLPSP